MKILANEIEIKRNESLTKDKALQAEKAHYQLVCSERDSSRGEINKASYTCQLKEGVIKFIQISLIMLCIEMVDQEMAEIRKLNNIIRMAESDILLARKKYEAELDQRNRIGVQLVQRNEELSLLYEKQNLQESVLRNGDVELQKREEVKNVNTKPKKEGNSNPQSTCSRNHTRNICHKKNGTGNTKAGKREASATSFIARKATRSCKNFRRTRISFKSTKMEKFRWSRT